MVSTIERFHACVSVMTIAGDVVRKPKEKGVRDQLDKEETERVLDHTLDGGRREGEKGEGGG